MIAILANTSMVIVGHTGSIIATLLSISSISLFLFSYLYINTVMLKKMQWPSNFPVNTEITVICFQIDWLKLSRNLPNGFKKLRVVWRSMYFSPREKKIVLTCLWSNWLSTCHAVFQLWINTNKCTFTKHSFLSAKNHLINGVCREKFLGYAVTVCFPKDICLSKQT